MYIYVMDSNLSGFEKAVLPEHREELEAVGQAAQERQVDYIGRGIVKERKDIFKEVLGERATPQQQSQASAQAQQQSSTTADVDKLAVADKSQKLQELVNLAATKGPVEASLIARNLNDPWLEDQFHDTLISFHDELVRRKKLKEE